MRSFMLLPCIISVLAAVSWEAEATFRMRRHRPSALSPVLAFSSLLVPRGGSVAPQEGPMYEDAVDMPESKLLEDGTVFPLTLSPSTVPSSAEEWVAENRERIVNGLLPRHGAVVIRGLDLPDAEAFSRVVKVLDFEEQPYIGGNAVRTVVAPGVFTSNESPPSERIPFHHEMAQVPSFPTKVLFYCETPSAKGGSTPIVRSDEVCDLLRRDYPSLYSRFKSEGVRYVRTAPMDDDSASALGRGWKGTFGTEERGGCEAKMREDGFEWEWLEGGDLKTTSKVLSAVRDVDGKEVFFNQVIAAYSGWNDSRNVASRAVLFGLTKDVLPAAEMDRFVSDVDGLAVSFEWKKGDVLIIDNRQVMHSRAPFVKPRRVLASLGR